MSHPMNAKEPTRGSGYLFEDDFSDASFDAPKPTTQEEIRKNAHITSGGEQALVACVKCGGSGMTRWGACFRCKGKGRIGVRSAAASKAKITRERNEQERRIEFAQTYSAECAYIHKRADKGSTFYASFEQKLSEYGTLTENQLAVVHKDMAKDAEFFAKRKAEREAAAPIVPTAGIQALFDRAPVKLVKDPIFRTTEITIKQAKPNSQNPGALYVYDTDTRDYLGKIVGGKWSAKWGTKDVTEALQKVAADPTTEAIAYARKFKACCCCGKALYNPVSVLAVVGPICGPRWGLDHLRMEAAALLDAEKAAEKNNE